MSRWRCVSPLPEPRSHVPTAAWGGKIYLFGGGGLNFQSLQSVGIYDPATDRWTTGREMPTLRSGAVAATLGDKIYVMGGGFKQADGTFVFFKTVEIYDPRTDTWEKGPDLRMPHDYPSVICHRDILYVFGGHHPDATQGGPLSDPAFAFSERLDREKGIWEEIPPMPTPRFATAAAAMGDRVYVLGGAGYRPEGFANFSLGEVYHPIEQRWRTEESFQIPWRAAGLAACAVAGRLLILGGFDGEAPSSRHASYDPSTQTWTEGDPIPEPRMAMAAVVLDDTLYLLGGRGMDRKTPVSTVFALSLR